MGSTSWTLPKPHSSGAQAAPPIAGVDLYTFLKTKSKLEQAPSGLRGGSAAQASSPIRRPRSSSRSTKAGRSTPDPVQGLVPHSLSLREPPFARFSREKRKTTILGIQQEKDTPTFFTPILLLRMQLYFQQMLGQLEIAGGHPRLSIHFCPEASLKSAIRAQLRRGFKKRLPDLRRRELRGHRRPFSLSPLYFDLGVNTKRTWLMLINIEFIPRLNLLRCCHLAHVLAHGP